MTAPKDYEAEARKLWALLPGEGSQYIGVIAEALRVAETRGEDNGREACAQRLEAMADEIPLNAQAQKYWRKWGASALRSRAPVVDPVREAAKRIVDDVNENRSRGYTHPVSLEMIDALARALGITPRVLPPLRDADGKHGTFPHIGPNGCHSNNDGDCDWRDCPQLRDNEPHATGRHCPLWVDPEES